MSWVISFLEYKHNGPLVGYGVFALYVGIGMWLNRNNPDFWYDRL